MLNHMQHFVAEAIHIFSLRSGPSNNNYRFTNINIRIGYPLIRFTFEHEITGIFERNAAASQIPKMPSYLHGILCVNIVHYVYGPVIPIYVNLLLCHILQNVFPRNAYSIKRCISIKPVEDETILLILIIHIVFDELSHLLLLRDR